MSELYYFKDSEGAPKIVSDTDPLPIGDVNVGDKTDAAVTDPTLTASEIALLKGLVKILSDVWDDASNTTKVTLQQVEGAIDGAVPTKAAFVGGKYSSADPTYHDGDLTPVRTNSKGEILTQLTGSIESITSAPVVGVKTVTATAAEIFAGASVKSNRRKLILKNEDSVLRFRIGPSTVTQQNGFPVEPGAVIEVQFDPATAIPIYAISEGANLQVAVMEI